MRREVGGAELGPLLTYHNDVRTLNLDRCNEVFGEMLPNSKSGEMIAMRLTSVIGFR